MVYLIKGLGLIALVLLAASFTKNVEAGTASPPALTSLDAAPENPLGPEYFGALAGQARVSAGGNAVYSLPIKLPPGINGLMPQLSINYNSKVKNGMMGLGWFLGGLSTSRITRCPQTLSQNGRTHSVDYTPDDRFCLDGQQLMVRERSYGEHWAVYSTEIDSFQRVESVHSAGSGPGWFIVRGKDGSIRNYGRRADAKIEAQGSTEVRVWALDEVKDHAGNNYSLFYNEDNAEGSYSLRQIQYTGNSRSGVTPAHTVDFEYEDRPDNRLHYQGGSKIRPHASRLVRILVSHQGQLLHEYKMAYGSAGVDERSRLVRIDYCDAQGNCQDPLKLSWLDDGNPRYQSRNVPMPYTNMQGDMYRTSAHEYTSRSGTAPRWHDMNGDGTADYVHVVPGSWGQYNGLELDFEIYLSGPDGRRTETWPSELSGAPTAFTWADLNGDGMTDVMRSNANGSNPHLDIALSTGSGFDMQRWPLPVKTGTFLYRDMNGDTLPDLVVRSSKMSNNKVHQLISVYVNEGEGFGPEQLWAEETVGKFELVDMNGDGLTDLIGDDRYVYINTGSGFSAEQDFGSAGYQKTSIYLDYNGDGLADRHTRATDGSCCSLQLNTGTAFTEGVRTSRYAVTDLDGSGINDGYARLNSAPRTHIDLHLAKDGSGKWHERIRRTFKGNRAFFFQAADINGDGFGDIALADQRICRIWTSGGNTYIGRCEDETHALLESQNKPLQLLSRIEWGSRLKVEFAYRPLTDHAIYKRGSGATLPAVDVQDSTYVVTRFDQPDGVGGQSSTLYTYESLRRDLGGRGHLGFGRITASNARANRVTVTNYSLRFPLAGQPMLAKTYSLEGDQLLELVENGYVIKGSLGSGGSGFAYLSGQGTSHYDVDTGDVLYRSIERRQVDDYGNAVRTEVEVTDLTLDSKLLTVTDSDYTVDASWIWRPGQLSSSTVTRWLNGESAVPGGITNSYRYDTDTGMLLSTTRQPGGATGIVLKIDLARDLSGNVISETVSGPGIATRTRLIEYDDRQQFPVAVVNAKGHRTSRLWDPARGVKLREIDPNGLTTTWTYTGFGRLRKEVRPNGTSSVIGLYRDDSGSLPNAVYYSEVQSTGLAATRVFYDEMGRTLRTRTRNFSGDYVNRDTRYDNRGRVARVSLPYLAGSNPAWNVSSYDDLNRVTAVQTADPANSVSHQYRGLDVSSSDALGRITQRQFNALGQLIATVDPLGTAMAMLYDSQGNRVQVTTGVLTSAQSSVNFTYDTLGRLLSQDDPNHGLYSYRYDALGNRISEQSPGMAATKKRVSYKYDVLGRLIRRVEPEGRTTWSYDNVAGGNLGLGKLHREIYRGFRRTTLHAPSAYGRPTSVQTTLDGFSYTEGMVYGANGQLATRSGPASPLSPGGYSVNYTYNALGHLERLSDGEGSTLYQLLATDAAGRTIEHWLGDGSVVSRDYQVHSGRTARQVAVSRSGTLQSFGYEYDELGNLEQRSDAVHGVGENFSYDPLSRLTHWQVSGAPQNRAAFSATGNIQLKSDFASDYGYDTARIHAVTRAKKGKSQLSYAYDPNGNLANGTEMPGITWSSYNKPTRLVKGNLSYTFSYGPDRRRYRKERNGNVTHYVGANFERNWLDTSQEYRHVVRVNGQAVMVRRELAGGTTNLYLHRDHLGSITAVTRGSDGEVLERYSYNPWGKRRSPVNWKSRASSTKWMRRGYTGHEHLDDIGLVHMNGRLYSPELGRMLSPDPVTQAPEEGRNYNRYTYAYNNPLRYTDPSGFSTKRKVIPEEITVTAAVVSSFVTGNVSALSFGIGPSSIASMDAVMEGNFQYSVLKTAMDSGVVAGQNENGELVNGSGVVELAPELLEGILGAVRWNSFSPGSTASHVPLPLIGLDVDGALAEDAYAVAGPGTLPAYSRSGIMEEVVVRAPYTGARLSTLPSATGISLSGGVYRASDPAGNQAARMLGYTGAWVGIRGLGCRRSNIRLSMLVRRCWKQSSMQLLEGFTE